MSLAAWLDEQGLARLEPVLRQAGIDIDVFEDLDDADLQAVGLNLGDRRRLLKAIKASPVLLAMPASESPAQTESKVAAPTVAERRHLTVMFCDLIGSTTLSTRLDPEDLRQVIDAYHRTVAAAVLQYDGHIAQLLGDGALVYFGYPKAHEDDGDRSVLAGIAALEAVSRMRPFGDLRVQARIGIASGLVVVGQIGTGTSAAEQSASGKTPNLAARLQSCARPGEIVVSMETRQLLGNSFELELLDPLELRGFDAPTLAWRVVSKRAEASRFEAQRTSQLTPLIGRESELSLLLDRWALARDGEGQVVLLSGEAGIGKSRIVQTLRRRLIEEPSTTLIWQCSPYFLTAALYPVMRQLERAAQFDGADSPQPKALKLEQIFAGAGLGAESMGHLLTLLGLSDTGRLPARQTPQEVKRHTLAAIADGVEAVAQGEPVLLLVEDAHWIDPTTEELLVLTIEQLRQSRVMILITCRPEYKPSWGNPTNLTLLTLTRLGQRHCLAMIDSVMAGKALPGEVVAEIVKKTDGIPLFLEELTKTVVESGLLVEGPDGFELKGPLLALAIPSTLQDSLMARLDCLAPAKEVAQAAAAIGREFEYGLLADVLNMQEPALGQALGELIQSELVVARGAPPTATYAFKHALIRDCAYHSMVRSQRAMRHAQIADSLERAAPEVAAAQPELLARHHQEAGHDSRAIWYWTEAGDLSWRRGGGREASIHYSHAIELASGQPASVARSELELSLLLKRGHALSTTEGYGSDATYRSFESAREIARKLGRAEDFVHAWAGSAPTLFGAGRLGEAIETLKELGSSQTATLEPKFQIMMATNLGVAHCLLGEVIEAQILLDVALKLDDVVRLTHACPVGGADPAIAIRSYGARTRMMQGYLEQGEAMATQSMAIAQSRGHLPTVAWATQIVLGFLWLKGEHVKLAAEAREALEHTERLRFKTRTAMGRLRLGQALVSLGDVKSGIGLMRSGIDLWASAGGKFHLSEFGALAAQTLLGVNQHEEARHFLVEAQAVQASTDERCYEAELIRMSGQLLHIDGNIAGAEAQFRGALQIAERRGLKLFSLRAASDLALLLQTQSGGREEALRILNPVYAWFTEGFDFPDLRHARDVQSGIAASFVS